MGNFKKVLAMVVVFALAISMVVTASAAAIFPDVDSSNDYASAISLLKSLSVVGGDDKGNFNPDNTITRAEFAKILFVVMNGDPDASLYTGPSSFSDVSANAWYNGYINWASNLGIVNGKGNNKFAPQDPVTTQEATKMFIVALTGKSTLAWPYGFVAEANKANISLYKDAEIANAAKPATRALIAQLTKNAIFATDVATFYTYDGQGNIVSRPNAAISVFDLKNLNTIIYETSNENYQLAGTTSSGISAIDQMTVANENGALVRVNYSTDLAGDYAGYNGSLYYIDAKDGTANVLDAKDTVVNFVTNNDSSATVKPLNILSSSYIYQLGGVQFDSRTDINANGKLVVMDKNGAVTSVPLTAAAIAPYFVADGSVSTSSTVEYGPNQDYDVKVVFDNDNHKVNMVYIVKNNPFVKLTTYNEDASVIAVNDATAFLMTDPNSTSKTLNTPTISLTGLTGTAPNKTSVVANDGINVGDYVAITPSRDFNGVTYTISPILANKNVTFTGISSSSAAMFGDITYSKNALVDAAVAAGTIPDSASVLTAANLGQKMNVYLDSTSKNYIYAELVNSASTDNYVFVNDITTTLLMGQPTFSIKVTDAKGTTTTYTLDEKAVSAFLDPTNTAAGSYGWKVTGGTAKTNADIYHKVVNLTLNSDNEVSKIDAIAASTSANLKYDTTFHAFYVGSSMVASVDDNTVAFYWDNAKEQLSIYTGKDLPSLKDGIGYYTTEGTLKVKAIQFTDMGTAVNTNVKYGVVSDYYTVAGSKAGMVKYVITATVDGQLTASLTTAEESANGPMGTLLAAANKSAKFVAFNFSSDGDTVLSMSTPAIASGSAMTDGAGIHVGIVTLASNGLYAINGVEFPANGYAAIVGDAKYFSMNNDSNIYLIPNTATAFAANKANLTPRLEKTSMTLSLGVQGNLVASTDQVRYVIVFNSDENNVIKDAFIYQTVLAKTTLGAPTGLAATAGDTQVALTWTAAANATGYTVAYKATADTTWTTKTVAANSATITGLTNGTSYDFKVLASNAEVTGAYSAVVSATLAAPIVG